MKPCSKCQQTKPLSDFGNEFKKKDGKKPFCKPCAKIIRKAAYDADPQKSIAKTQAWKHKNADRAAAYMKEIRIAKRKEVVDGYGGKCTCCGEARIEFLTLEHVHGGGNKHRQGRGSLQTYRDVIKEGFPDKYTILCMNCNFAKAYGKDCPHMTNTTDKQKIAALVEALECERARDFLNAEGTSEPIRKLCMDTLAKYGYDKNGHATYQQWTDDKTTAALALAKGE